MKPTKNSAPITRHNVLDRRDFLLAGLVTTVGWLLPYEAGAALSKLFSAERELSFL